MRGIVGDNLNLSVEGNDFYNETFAQTCQSDPKVMQFISLSSLGSVEEALTIEYAMENPTICGVRQKLVLE